MSNAQIQKYKNTNTAYDRVSEIPNMWYIFEMRIVQGYQKLYSHTIQTWTSEFRTVVRGLVDNIISRWWGGPYICITFCRVLLTVPPGQRDSLHTWSGIQNSNRWSRACVWGFYLGLGEENTEIGSTPIIGCQINRTCRCFVQKHRKNCECCPMSLLIVR